MKRFICIMTACLFAASVAFAQDAKKPADAPQKEKTKEQYLADLSSKDEKTIIDAAEWLGSKEEKGAVPGLVKLIKNDDRVKVRVHAAVALGLIKDESAVDALNEALLNDSSADVRYASILALSRIGSTKSIDAFKKAREKETDPFIKDYIAKMEEKLKKK
jgi:HEAT repeat protein